MYLAFVSSRPLVRAFMSDNASLTLFNNEKPGTPDFREIKKKITFA